MVSQATVQSKTNYGFSKAADALGAPCPWYRATDTTNPIAAGNLLGSKIVLFDTSPNLSQQKASDFGKLEGWFAGFDVTGVEAGDYLVDATYGIFFVAAIELFRAVRMIRCNEVISIGRPSEPITGPAFYSGATTLDLSPLISDWPAAVQQDTKGEGGEIKLPGDTKMPRVKILLPTVPNTEFLLNDWAYTTDSTPRYFTLESIEMSKLGNRMTALEASG